VSERRPLPGAELNRLFPFHFAVDRQMNVVGLGPSLAKLLPSISPGQRLDAHFRIVSPNVGCDFAAIEQQDFTVFFLDSLERGFRLKGQMLRVREDDADHLLFLGSPVMAEIGALSRLGLTLKDFAIHDSAIDFLILLQTQNNSLNDIKGMAERLKREVAERREVQKALQRTNEDLEERVRERTRALEAANIDLQAEIGERRRAEQQTRESNARLQGLVLRLEEHNRQMQLLNAMGDMLQASDSLEQAFGVVSESLERLFPASSGGALAVRGVDGSLAVVARWGRPTMAIGEYLQRDDCWALRRVRMHESHGGDEEAVCGHARHGPPLPGHSHVCAPLTTHGVVHGLLHLADLPEQVPSEQVAATASDLRQLIHSASEQISLAIANLELRESLRQQSIRDSLTGLYNRRHMEAALHREMARADRTGDPCGVILLDVDHFKAFNDRHGHPAGDSLLAGLGQFLAERVRGADVACRYGGEEFVLILSAAKPEVALRRAEQIRLAVAEAFAVSHDGEALPPVTISLGVACYPAHARDAEGLIAAADAALYQAKRDGRDAARLSSGLAAAGAGGRPGSGAPRRG